MTENTLFNPYSREVLTYIIRIRNSLRTPNKIITKGTPHDLRCVFVCGDIEDADRAKSIIQ